ncbi:hypothetical protein [Mycolicibacterium canariasense]|uniref:hypothetical protein n=1 Tax=Mycolicibacterium canariasense TaxID=228230 RepID=UPI0013FDA503|nr:hypothetical protein [Mycolicibacterium canariasense]MCV7208369.1 hypothetical protein [Mycolicibacterium canariasense]
MTASMYIAATLPFDALMDTLTSPPDWMLTDPRPDFWTWRTVTPALPFGGLGGLPL